MAKKTRQIKKNMEKEQEEKTEVEVLNLTNQQRSLIQQAQGQIQMAQGQLNMIIATIFAGVGIDAAQVTGIEDNKLMFVRSPEPEDAE